MKRTAPIPAPVQAPLPPAWRLPAIFQPAVWVSPILFACATGALFTHNFKMVWMFLVAELIWKFLSSQPNPGMENAFPAPAASPVPIMAFMGCFAALAVILGSFPSYHWLFPKFTANEPFAFQWILVFLLLRFALAFKALPPRGPIPDYSPYYSRILFFLLFALGIWLRFHRIGETPAAYWDDCAEDIFNARNKAEMGKFSFISAMGTEEPFFQYTAGFLAYFFQNIPNLVLHRLTLGIIGMASIWVFYLLGKEAGGRRVGLVMMGLGAVCKPLVLISSQILLHFNGLTLATSVALLFFVRMLKKPSLAHFLQWGAATAFGVYTYVAFRGFLPILLVAPLLWVLSDRKERDEMKPGEWVFFIAAVGACAFYLLYGLNFWKYPSFFSEVHQESGFFFPGLVLALLLPSLYRFFSAAYSGGRHPKISGWVVGALQFVVLSAAVLGHPMILARLATLDMFVGMTFVQKLARMGERLQNLIYFLFYGTGGFPDSAPANDAFFGYTSALWVICGGAFALGRINWFRFCVLLLACAGMGTFILSSDPHSGKVLGGAVCFMFLGSLALVRAWDAMGSVWPKLRSGFSSALVFLVVIGFTAWATNHRVFHDWLEVFQDGNTLTVKQAKRDVAAGFRVFIANSQDYPSNITTVASSEVLLEGTGVGYLRKENQIDLGPGEKEPDVVVLFAPDQDLTKQALAEDYPGSQVSAVPGSNIQRLQIPFVALEKGSVVYQYPKRRFRKIFNDPKRSPEPIFVVRRAGANEWLRRFYTHFSLARGLVWSQDRNADLNAPHPVCLFGGVYTARLYGGLHVDKGGKYSMTYSSIIPSIINVDGQKVVDDRPLFRKPEKSVKKVSLKLDAGEHKIEMICDFNGGGPAPVLEFRPADQPLAAPMPMGAPPLDRAKD